MKIIFKAFWLVSFASLVLLSALPVKAYAAEPNVELYMGRFVSLDKQQQQITAKVEVPGSSGVQEVKTLPFTIDKKTTVQICFKTKNECDSFVGKRGWNRLADLEKRSDFSAIQKNVALVQDSKNNRTLHVVIVYTK